MADQHHIKSLYRDVELSEAELATYRSRLAQALPEKRRFSLAVPMFAAAVVLAAFMWFQFPKPLDQQGLDQLQAYVATYPEQARKSALQWMEDDGIQGHNAAMVLALTQEGDAAMEAAALALARDPRAEFRFFYLELLLDNADEYVFNPDLLDQLLEREYHPGCVRLFEQLLRFT